MIPLYTILTFLVIHWIFDFHLQTDWMAQNKSRDNRVLLDHSLVYAMGLCTMMALNANVITISTGMQFLVVNFLAHFLTDWVTSRATSALYKEGRIHDFFVVVGADQMIHGVTLFGTFVWLTQ